MTKDEVFENGNILDPYIHNFNVGEFNYFFLINFFFLWGNLDQIS